jgi:hypothetical protein
VIFGRRIRLTSANTPSRTQDDCRCYRGLSRTTERCKGTTGCVVFYVYRSSLISRECFHRMRQEAVFGWSILCYLTYSYCTAQLPRTLWSGQIHPHSPEYAMILLGKLLIALLSSGHTATDDRSSFPASAAHDVLWSLFPISPSKLLMRVHPSRQAYVDIFLETLLNRLNNTNSSR